MKYMDKRNEQIYLLGNLVDVVKVVANEPKFNYDGKQVLFYMQQPEDKEAYDAYMRGLFNSLSSEIITPIFEKAYQKCKKVTKTKPSLEFYYRKTIWGRCDVSSNRIYLNKDLIMFPKECIELVVIHEFCHFVSLDHDKRFYQMLSYFYPEWEKTEKLMEKFEKKFNGEK